MSPSDVLAMSVAAIAPERSVVDAYDHDHTWLRVRGDLTYASVLEYRCIRCGLAWSL